MANVSSFLLAELSDVAIPATASVAQANQVANHVVMSNATSETMSVATSLPASHTDALLNAVQHSSDTWSNYFGSLATLFLLLGALWLIAWLIRKKGVLFSANGVALYIESRLALGGKKFLVIARVNNQRLLLGVTDQNISLLTQLEDNECASKTGANTPFSKVLLEKIEKDTTQRKP